MSVQSEPLYLQKYRDSSGVEVVEEEVQLAFPLALPSSELLARYGEYKSLLTRVQWGNVHPESDIKHVKRDPDLWELRWSFPDGTEWRMYHSEPELFPRYLVGLRFHEKWVDGDDAEVRARQNQEIDTASYRYVDGRAWQWGIP